MPPQDQPQAPGADAERRLREQERFFTTLLECAFDGVAVLGEEGRISWVMPGPERFLGYSADELMGSGAFELVHPDDISTSLESLGKVLLTPGTVVETEARFRHKDGSWRRLQVRATNRLDDPAVRGVVISHREVTDRDRALNALKSSETRYQSLVDAMSEGVVLQDDTGTIRACNPAAERILGLSFAQLAGLTSFDPRWRAVREDGTEVPGDEHPAIVTLRTGQSSQDVVMGVHRPDGSLAWLNVSSRLIRDPTTGKPRATVTTFADITARKHATEQVEHTLAQLERITDTVPCVVFQYLLKADGTQCFPHVSRRAHELIGVEAEALQRDALLAFRSVFPDDLSEMTAKARAAVASRSAWSHEWRIRRADGQIHWLSGRATPEPGADGTVVWTGFVIDVTHEKRLELRLGQAQRMESVGRLAGGVAHDFNNLLTVITGNLDLLAARAAWGPEQAPYAAAIRAAAERGSAFTRQLLSFTRSQVATPGLVHLNEVVERILPLLSRLVEDEIEIAPVLGPAIGAVRADTSQIEQLLLNLVVNARDAIDGPGRITIETAELTVTPLDAEDGELPAGDWSMLMVGDTGCGIRPEIREQIFEPFFSTKPPGQGTGLGLATCYGIVARADGRILVESEVGRGSVFRVYWPRLGGPVLREPAPAPVDSEARGRGAVLVVEDDPAVRAVAHHTLQRAGYAVLEAGDGDEAFEVARRHPGPIEVLVVDLVMQRTSGMEVAERLRRERPDLAVLVISGRDLDERTAARMSAMGAEFLAKPFKPLELLHRIGPLAGASRR